MFNSWQIQKNRLRYLFRQSPRICLISHQKPDGDSLGSLLAFTQIFPSAVPLSCDVVPSKFSFLPHCQKIQSTNHLEIIKKAQLLVTLDSGTYQLTGLEKIIARQKITIPLINIDHHHDNKLYGNINLISPASSSTAEIIFDLLHDLNYSLDKDIATCLLVGILGDTDGFKNSNTSEKTLKVTSALLNTGININLLARHILQDRSLAALKLWGKALARLKINPRLNLASTVVTLKDFQETQADTTDIEGMTNFLNSIPNVKAVMVLSQRKANEIKGSFRTLHDNIDVSRLAAVFGGGGHKKAAGFTIAGNLEEKANQWSIS